MLIKIRGNQFRIPPLQLLVCPSSFSPAGLSRGCDICQEPCSLPKPLPSMVSWPPFWSWLPYHCPACWLPEGLLGGLGVAVK